MNNRTFILIVILGILLRLFVVLRTEFPMNQGGMFYVMTQDLINNGFKLPVYTTYNFSSIPFAYSPLGFYVTGFLHVITNVSILSLMKGIPFVFSMATVLVYYVFSKRVLGSTQAALTAMLLYIFSVSGYISQVEGASITRAPALTFGLLSLIAAFDMYRHKKAHAPALTAVYLGITALFHLETAVFVVYSIAALYMVYSRTVRGGIDTIVTGVGALVVTMPWWVSVILNHGLAPFMAALRSSPWNMMGGLDLQQISLMRYFVNPLFDPFPSLAVLGGIACIVKRQWFLPVWFLVLFFTASRLFFTTTGIIPLGMMAGYALAVIILPMIRKSVTAVSWHGVYLSAFYLRVGIYMVSIGFLLFCFLTNFWHPFGPFQALSSQQRQAMGWVAQNTPQSARFVVLTPVPSWAWFLDPVSEWFPALAGRHNMLTIQAYEWVPGFSRRIASIEQVKRCGLADLVCLEDALESQGMEPEYLYLSKPFQIEPDSASCCALLTASLASSPDYQLVYDGPGAAVWQKTGNAMASRTRSK